jgi:hypothetical protein
MFQSKTTAPHAIRSNRKTTSTRGVPVKSNLRAGFTPVPIPSPRSGSGGGG